MILADGYPRVAAFVIAWSGAVPDKELATAMAPSNGTQWPPYHGAQPWHLTMASSNDTLPNGTHQLHLTRAPYHGTQKWHHTMASSNGTTSTLPKCVAHCIQQWHPTTSHPAMPTRWHPSMASSNGAQQWHPTTWHPAMAPYNGTQQRRLTMAPSNGAVPWHPAMAPYHGTQQWHHVQSLEVCHNHPPPIASSNGTLSDGTQQWHHVQSANVCNHPPRLLDVRTPIAKAIWGKNI